MNLISCADLDKLRRIAKKVFKLNTAFKPNQTSSDFGKSFTKPKSSNYQLETRIEHPTTTSTFSATGINRHHQSSSLQLQSQLWLCHRFLG